MPLNSTSATSSLAIKTVAASEKVKDVIKVSDCLTSENKGQLLALISTLEAEVEAREVAVGVLKSECLKHLLNSQEKSPDNLENNYLRDPFYALQRDGVISSAIKVRQVEQVDLGYMRLQTLLAKHRLALKKAVICLKQSEDQRIKVDLEVKRVKDKLEEIEEEEKRRKKKEEEEKKEGGEEKQPENNKELEEELKKKDEKEQQLVEEVNKLKEALKEDQKQKLQLVMLLIHDRKQIASVYLEEKRRAEDLARALSEERRKTHSLARELEEESKRSLAMEAEVEHYVRQLTDLKEESKKYLLEEKRKSCELEEALRRSKQESEHLRKQLAEAHRVAMSQASAAIPNQAFTAHRGQNAAQEVGFGLGNADTMSGLPKVSPGGRSIKNKDDTDLDNSETYFMRSGGASSSRTSSSTIRSGAVTAAPTAAVKVSDAFASSTTSTMVAAKKQIAKTTAVIGKGLQAKVGVPPPVPPNKPAIVRSNINFQSQTQTK